MYQVVIIVYVGEPEFYRGNRGNLFTLCKFFCIVDESSCVISFLLFVTFARVFLSGSGKGGLNSESSFAA